MKSFTRSLIILLGFYQIFSNDQSGCCLESAWQPPRPNISLRAVRAKQSLVVSWLVNSSGSVGDINQIQIIRADNSAFIYNKNVSAASADSHKYTWTWTSDLPLECVDHSVRVRHFYSPSGPGPWSEWVTNCGVKAKNETEMFPFQRVLREGTSAKFCCVPPVGVNITSITFNDSKYPPITVGARVKAITVDNLTIPTAMITAHRLGCVDTSGKISSVWNYVSFPPQKPRNLSCTTSHMTTVTCTWDQERARDPYDRNNQTRTLHIENSDQPPINCEQSSCTFPAIPHLEEYNISLLVKDQLGEVTENYSFNISDRVVPVVEWDRVSPGVTDSTVSWTVQENLAQVSLFCQVAINQDNTAEQLKCNSVNGLCKVKLNHLLPNTHYLTKVRCSVNGRLWGKWTRPISFTTYPFFTLHLWRKLKQMSDFHSRQVTLLWMLDAPESATTVTIQGYTVQWSQEGQNRTESMWKDSEQTQTEVYIGPGQYNFTVQAVLHAAPPIPAQITIPKLDKKQNLRVEKRLSSSTAGGFNLSWAQQDTATCGYTVEWCILGNVVPCTLRWIKMAEGKNTLFLPARDFKAGRRYTFNIYGCTEKGHMLLEIQTGYSQESEAVQSPILVEPVQSTSSSVTLEWHFNENDPFHPAFITGYLVTVQEVGCNKLPCHTEDKFNVSDPQRKSFTIEGLKQNLKYTLSVSALTKKGPGQPTSITISTRPNYSADLAKILPPILLMLGCTILLWPQRNMLKRGLKEIFAYPAGMNIKTSELDSFLHETVERVQSHKLEECVSCDIEILNTHPPLNETRTLRDPETLNTPSSPSSQTLTSSLSLPCVLHQDYCPQTTTLLCERPALQQATSITNKTYFHTMVEDFSEPPEAGEIRMSFKHSDCLQESCSVIEGYISNDTS